MQPPVTDAPTATLTTEEDALADADDIIGRASVGIPCPMSSPPAPTPRDGLQKWGEKALVCDALVNEQLEAVANEAGRGDTHCSRAQSANRATEATRTLSSPSLHAAPVHKALSNEPADAFANEQDNADAGESTETDAMVCSFTTSGVSSVGTVASTTQAAVSPALEMPNLLEALVNEQAAALANEPQLPTVPGPHENEA